MAQAPALMGCVWQQWPLPPSPGMLSFFFFFLSNWDLVYFIYFPAFCQGVAPGQFWVLANSHSISKAWHWYFTS